MIPGSRFSPPMKCMKKWKTCLIYTHRYLGLAFCLLFTLWFISGIVMVYKRMPRLSAEERLQRLPPLDFTRASWSPHQAWQKVGLPEAPEKVRLGMLGQRPVYRFLTEARGWVMVAADTGEVVPPVTAPFALEVVRSHFPGEGTGPYYLDLVTIADQWTLSSALRQFKPLHKVTLEDRAGTVLYVSQVTGEVVLKTTREGRFWGWMGAVIHWLYFTPLRQRVELWRGVIIYGSAIGCLMCLSGIVVGLWRYRTRNRYRIRGREQSSPYTGLMRWHHYLGLFFGLITFTWILSGLFSMNPGRWSPGNSPTTSQRRAASGGPLDLAGVALAPAAAIEAFAIDFPPREIEVVQFRGRPYYLAYRPPSRLVAGQWSNTDNAAFLAAESPLPHLLIAADGSEQRLQQFSREEMVEVAREAMPGTRIREAVWLDRYDAFYYHRARGRRLPVLRVKYEDPRQTWLYLDPYLGVIAQKEDRLSRIERWLYNGLHSLDLPYLYQASLTWEVVVVGLSLGGIALSVSAVWLTLHRARRAASRRSLSLPGRFVPPSVISTRSSQRQDGAGTDLSRKIR